MKVHVGAAQLGQMKEIRQKWNSTFSFNITEMVTKCHIQMPQELQITQERTPGGLTLSYFEILEIFRSKWEDGRGQK